MSDNVVTPPAPAPALSPKPDDSAVAPAPVADVEAIRAELLTLTALSWPIVISNLLSFSLAVICQLLVGHVSAAALGAVALATMFSNATGFSVLLGTANACDTLCSQAFGAGNLPRVGLIARRGVAIALASSVGIAALWAFGAGPFFRALGIEPDIADAAQAYVRILIIGLPAQVVVEVFKKPLISCGLSGVAMAISAVGIVPCVALGALLVFQSPLGFRGAALANAISQWLTLAAVVVFARNHRALAAAWYRVVAPADGGAAAGAAVGAASARPALAAASALAETDDSRFSGPDAEAAVPVAAPVAAPAAPAAAAPPAMADVLDAIFPPLSASFGGVLDGWREYLAIGVPSASMLFVEWGSYECLALLAGRLGPIPLAAHAVLATTATLSFMPFLGFSIATCVRVGQCLGDSRPDGAQLTIRVALLCAVGLFTLNAIAIFAVRSFWGEIFVKDLEVVAVVARMLPFLALYTIFDGLQCVLAGILRGAALAVPAAAINLCAYVFGIALAAGLADPTGAAWGLGGIWFAFCIAVFIASVCMSGVVRWQDWAKLAADASARSTVTH